MREPGRSDHRMPGMGRCRTVLYACTLLLAGFPPAGTLAGTLAQSSPVVFPQSLMEGEVLTVYGRVFEEDGQTPWADGDTVVVENRRTRERLRSPLGGMEPQWYGVSFVDFSGAGTIANGDTLDFTFLQWRLLEPTVHVVRTEDLNARMVRFDLRVGSLDRSGACCITETQCEVLPEAYCWNGRYLGDGTTCADSACQTVDVRDLDLAGHTGLEGTRPNPFHTATAIEYRVASRGGVSVSILDAGGRRVRDLSHAAGAIGRHTVSWDGRDNRGIRVPCGLYFVRLVAADGTSSRPIVLLE